MKYNSAIAIVGPTGSGKTAVAFEFARRVGIGEVVNLDKMCLFKHFPISSGLVDVLKEKGVSRHLYELLEPDEEIIPVATYIEMVRKACAQILSGGGLPIIEGGPTTYVPGLLEANKKAEFCKPVGLRPSTGFNLREAFVQRLDAALREGLIDEVKVNLNKYRNTLVMTDAHSVVPLVHYLDGEIDLAEAKEEIVNRALKYAQRQMEIFKPYPEIAWLNYESSRLSQTVEKILTLI